LATNPSVAQRFFRNDAHTALSPATFKMVWKSNGEPAKYEDVESIFVLPGRERHAAEFNLSSRMPPAALGK
jgi:hypothetical protein